MEAQGPSTIRPLYLQSSPFVLTLSGTLSMKISSKTPRGPIPIHSHTKLRPPMFYYRGWDGWMTSPTGWTWVWASSGSWWWTGKPGMLPSVGSQRAGHDCWTDDCWTEPICYYFLSLPLTWKSTLNIPWKDWCWSYSSRLWPPGLKSWLIGKSLDTGKNWRQEQKGETEDEVVGWHHRLNGHEFEQTLGDCEGQESWRAAVQGATNNQNTEQLKNNS